MKTYMASTNPAEQDWILIDAAGKNLGRLASTIAFRLRGKHKATFTPHADVGDNIVVINSADLAVTGNKLKNKEYHRHSGYPGGLKTTTLESMQADHPGRALELAVKGMLPRGPLGRAMFRKLKVYGGSEHPHAAQNPQLFDAKEAA